MYNKFLDKSRFNKMSMCEDFQSCDIRNKNELQDLINKLNSQLGLNLRNGSKSAKLFKVPIYN